MAWDHLPGVVAALVVLVLGWILARILAASVRAALGRTRLGATLARLIMGEEEAEPARVEHWGGQITYYLVMLFVLVGFFQTLGLTLIAQPLNTLLNQVFSYAPRLLAAALLLALAWAAASIARALVHRFLKAIQVDQRLGQHTGDEEAPPALAEGFSQAVYWVVWVLFLPLVLTALQLHGLLGPVQGMIDRALSYLPHIVAAAVILAAGWLGGRMVQRLVVRLVAAIGLDRFMDDIGAAQVLGKQRPSDLLGLLAYAAIFVIALIAALNALALEAITAPASDMLALVLQAIPAVLGAALLLVIAYAVARIVSRLLASVLAGAGFNRIMAYLGLSREPAEGERTPADIAGYLLLVVVMLFAVVEAAGLLGFNVLAQLVAQLIVFVWQVVLGLIILGLGLYLARVAHDVIRASAVVQAQLMARLARVAIIVLAGAMALRQMGLANEIIILAFGLLLGALAVAAAIAFGLGGRDLAARELDRWADNMRKEEE